MFDVQSIVAQKEAHEDPKAPLQAPSRLLNGSQEGYFIVTKASQEPPGDGMNEQKSEKERTKLRK